MCDATKKDKNMTVTILSLLNQSEQNLMEMQKFFYLGKFIYNRT